MPTNAAHLRSPGRHQFYSAKKCAKICTQGNRDSFYYSDLDHGLHTELCALVQSNDIDIHHLPPISDIALNANVFVSGSD